MILPALESGCTGIEGKYRHQFALFHWLGEPMSRGLKFAKAPIVWLLDFVYPPACLVCGAPLEQTHRLICPSCEAQLIPLEAQGELDELWIARQKNLPVYLDGFLAGFLFEPTIQALIHELKYRNQKRVGRFLGEKLARRFAELWGGLQIDQILPVPLHRKKQGHRGYNQSAILARAISGQTGIPFSEKVIRRIRNTPTNTGLTASQRFENMKNGFELLPNHRVEEKSFLLVDDVITTGATANACAQPLKAAGAARVLALSIAHPALEQAELI